MNATKATVLYYSGYEKEAAFHFHRAYEFYTIHGSLRLSNMLDKHLELIGFDINLINYDVTHPAK